MVQQIFLFTYSQQNTAYDKLSAMALFRDESNVIGLDIGTTGIRLVQVKNSNTESRLVTYGSLPMDSSIIQSDSEADRQQVISGVKKLLTESKVSTKNVIAGMPTSKVFSAVISLPKMNTGELEKSVRYQAEQHVPMQLDQVKLDWMLVGETETQQEVMLVAAPITLAERSLSLLEAAGLEVVALEPDAMALTRSLVTGPEGVVVLDIGANSTDLIVAQNRIPKLVRSIPVGGESFVKAAANNLNLEADQAMQFVYKFGLAQGKLEGQVQNAIKTSVDSLVSELDKSIKFFQSRYKDVAVSKVILTGKASVVPELPAYIANNVNMPVEIGNAWGKINTPANLQPQLLELSNQFAVACGLAARGAIHE